MAGRSPCTQGRASASRSSSYVPEQLIRIPNALGNLPVKRTALVEVSLLEPGMRSEGQAALALESQEARIVIVALRVQRTGEEVLAVVVRELPFVGQIPVAGVEALRQEQESTNAVAVCSKVSRVAELVGVALRLVRQDVFDLVTVSTGIAHVFDIP
jgi:hypothetical protein